MIKGIISSSMADNESNTIDNTTTSKSEIVKQRTFIPTII
jgi:hypothetical protein